MSGIRIQKAEYRIQKGRLAILKYCSLAEVCDRSRISRILLHHEKPLLYSVSCIPKFSNTSV